MMLICTSPVRAYAPDGFISRPAVIHPVWRRRRPAPLIGRLGRAHIGGRRPGAPLARGALFNYSNYCCSARGRQIEIAAALTYRAARFPASSLASRLLPATTHGSIRVPAVAPPPPPPPDDLSDPSALERPASAQLTNTHTSHTNKSHPDRADRTARPAEPGALRAR